MTAQCSELLELAAVGHDLTAMNDWMQASQFLQRFQEGREEPLDAFVLDDSLLWIGKRKLPPSFCEAPSSEAHSLMLCSSALRLQTCELVSTARAPLLPARLKLARNGGSAPVLCWGAAHHSSAGLPLT